MQQTPGETDRISSRNIKDWDIIHSFNKWEFLEEKEEKKT